MLAWKTGTSYGFRDAWAIGVGPRHLIGIWIGRPDGTPVPGQFGLASAAPLLLQVHDLLVNRDAQRGIAQPPDPQPPEVDVAAICWPLGQPMAKGDPNCRRLRFAWTLEGTTPPTLLAADQPLGLGLRQPLWVDTKGRQVAPGCAGARALELVLWPAPLEPWLPRRERRAARLPAPDPACPPSLPPPAAPLSIVGVREGDQLRRPAGSAEPLRLKLSALGGSGRLWWFLDGAPITATAADESFDQLFRRSGRHQLSVLDEAGQTARLEFAIAE
ncbi:penicillin-binding protein 1C [compost metagenome]